MLEEDRLRLGEIVARCDFILGWTEESDEAGFVLDIMRRDAVAMSLLVIGETARRLSDDVKALAPDLAWPAIIALRNRIAHGYETIDPLRVWRIALDDIPELRAAV
jgi:uncharacterized protein with HEPN domain